MTVTNNRNQNNRLDLMAYIPSIQQFIHLIDTGYCKEKNSISLYSTATVSAQFKKAVVIWSKVKVAINDFVICNKKC